jgi:hypothetical protein
MQGCNDGDEREIGNPNTTRSAVVNDTTMLETVMTGEEELMLSHETGEALLSSFLAQYSIRCIGGHI